MHRRLRSFVASLLVAVCLAASAQPVFAEEMSQPEKSRSVNVVLDTLILRPVGFLTLIGGTALFVVSAPLVLITRPMEIGKPFEHMVARPARFLWLDPIGQH